MGGSRPPGWVAAALLCAPSTCTFSDTCVKHRVRVRGAHDRAAPSQVASYPSPHVSPGGQGSTLRLHAYKPSHLELYKSDKFETVPLVRVVARASRPGWRAARTACCCRPGLTLWRWCARAGGAALQARLARRAHCALQSVLELEGLHFRYQPSWLMSMIGGSNAIASYNHVGPLGGERV